jgi:hypothetical protein
VNLVDLDELTADDLAQLAGIKRDKERRAEEERTARLAEVMYQPALGWYLMQREERSGE